MAIAPVLGRGPISDGGRLSGESLPPCRYVRVRIDTNGLLVPLFRYQCTCSNEYYSAAQMLVLSCWSVKEVDALD